MIGRFSRLKNPLISSSLETLAIQFQQRCSVSGTAKGKGKLKDAAPLKRSIIPKKKGAKPAAGGGGGGGGGGDGGGGRMNELNKMVDACLSAPTPIRYLKPKQREREAEREKLGLISKDRQREIDTLKAKTKEKKKSSSDKSKENEDERPVIFGTPGMDLISLGLVDKEAIPKYNLTVEDGRRLAKEYSKVLMKKHRARQAAESTILRLKKEAIEALPEHLKAAALVPDLTPFPANRFMATLTPPIEGYIEKIMEATKKNIGKEKLR